jgi:hypothetical protein
MITRPRMRGRFLLEKFVATQVICGALTLACIALPATILLGGRPGGSEIIVAFVTAGVLGSLAYTSLYLFLGLWA